MKPFIKRKGKKGLKWCRHVHIENRTCPMIECLSIAVVKFSARLAAWNPETEMKVAQTD